MRRFAALLHDAVEDQGSTAGGPGRLDEIRERFGEGVAEIVAADKIHNVRSIRADRRRVGEAVFDWFLAPRVKPSGTTGRWPRSSGPPGRGPRARGPWPRNPSGRSKSEKKHIDIFR